MADADDDAKLDERYPAVAPARRALAEVQAAEVAARAMPAGIVRTKLKTALFEARGALERAQRVCRNAARFEAVIASTPDYITLPKGLVRRGRN